MNWADKQGEPLSRFPGSMRGSHERKGNARPPTCSEVSWSFNLRLDPSLHEILVTGALREGKTLNAFVKDVLEKAVSEVHA